MDATDEMIARACRKHYGETWSFVEAEEMRDTLAAALADVPEPGIGGARLTAIYLDEARLFAAEQRVAELEAQVRALLQPPLPTGAELDEYHYAPGGEGRYAAEWADKPHRLLFDVIDLARRALRRNGELEAQLADAKAACVKWNETVAEGMNALTEWQARAEAAEAQLAKADVCEVCGDCLMPEPVRCEKHVHTERGDPEWTFWLDGGEPPE